MTGYIDLYLRVSTQGAVDREIAKENGLKVRLRNEVNFASREERA